MKHSNISVFVPHIGCPHLCSFCNQRTISGAEDAPTGDDVRMICKKALAEVKEPQNAEIAFFGGSFTAVPRDYMLELLTAASEFVGDGKFSGIRCSTRPDCIDEDILQLLRESGVTAIELGAQSMDDEVLALNERGHTSQDVESASELIKAFGFELGLQMMIGLYGSTPQKEWETVKKIAAIRPDTVRIYPVVVLKGTRLGELLLSGEYKPFEFDTAVDIAASAMLMFGESGIRVIKCGLHASEFVEKDMIGGFYHPAFRELCEALIYRRIMHDRLCAVDGGKAVIAVNDRCISKAAGQKKSNLEYFRERGFDIRIVGDKDIPKYQCELRR